MSALARLFEHNTWANKRVIAALRKAPEEWRGSGPEESAIRTLRHLLHAEAAFPAAMEGRPIPAPPRAAAPDALEAASASCGEVLVRLAGGDAAFLACRFKLPWVEDELTVQDGLSQVLTHSGQHRAEVARALADAGTDAGNLDFLVWLREKSGAI